MRTTTQRKTATRQRIIDAAGLLFREHGVDGTGVDAVMRLAGLTHGGFYLHFASKEALAAEVARSLLEQAATRWDGLSRLPDHQAALKRIVETYLNPAHAMSDAACPLTTLGPDVARRAESRDAMSGALRGMLDALARLVGRDQAAASLATMVGAVVLARLADDPTLAEAFLAAAAASVLATDVNQTGTACRPADDVLSE
ncbi:TetR/AcrR family transcriptional regulator [Rhodopila sp.]|uniref:TetR/AcrR family transcriptional regulator n=1 Tax=Rhodopila sp. TaxID=2480087 RepID=UPI003D110072